MHCSRASVLGSDVSRGTPSPVAGAADVRGVELLTQQQTARLDGLPPHGPVEIGHVPGELVQDQGQAERDVLVLQARVARSDRVAAQPRRGGRGSVPAGAPQAARRPAASTFATSSAASASIGVTFVARAAGPIAATRASA